MSIEEKIVKLQTDVNCLKCSQIIGGDNSVCFVNNASIHSNLDWAGKDYILIYATEHQFPVCSLEVDVYENGVYRAFPHNYVWEVPGVQDSIGIYSVEYDATIFANTTVIDINGHSYDLMKPNIFSRGFTIAAYAGTGSDVSVRVDFRLKSNVRGIFLVERLLHE